MTYDSKSEKQTAEIAGKLADRIRSLPPRIGSNRASGGATSDAVKQIVSRGTKPAGERAVVVALEGELGAGKTTFIKAFAAKLGVKQKLTSPTFVIMRQYGIESRIKSQELWSSFKTLVHIDAYRLNDGNELKLLGIEEIFNNPENIVMIEWAERVSDIIPDDAITVYIDHVSETTRKFTISGQ